MSQTLSMKSNLTAATLILLTTILCLVVLDGARHPFDMRHPRCSVLVVRSAATPTWHHWQLQVDAKESSESAALQLKKLSEALHQLESM
eukprot:3930136-Amphidinium_carterae.3